MTETLRLLLAFIQNVSIVFALIYFATFQWTWLYRRVPQSWFVVRQWGIGVIFAVAATVAILLHHAFPEMPPVLDGTLLLVGLGAMLGGWRAGLFLLISLSIAQFFNPHHTVAYNTLINAFGIGLGIAAWYRVKGNIRQYSWVDFGAVALLMGASALLIIRPDELRLAYLLILLIAQPLACMLIGVAYIHNLERVQTLESIQSSEARYRQMIGKAVDPIMIFTAEGKIVEANEAVTEITGYSAQELLNLTSNEIILYEDANAIARILKGDVVHMESSLRRKDGTLIFIECNAIRIGDNLIQKIFRDITARKLAEQALTRQNEIQQLITKISTDFINVPIQNLASAIENALGQLSHYIEGADRGFVFLIDSERELTSLVYEWCGEGIASIKDQNQNRPLTEVAPDWFKDVFSITDVESARSTLGENYERLRQQDIRGLLGIQLVYNNALIGWVGFDSVRKTVQWSERDIQLLRLVGEIFTNAIQRRETQLRLQVQNSYLTALHETTLALVNKTDLNEVLKLILEHAAALLNTHDGSINLLHESGEYLYRYIAIGAIATTESFNITKEFGVSGRVWQTGQILAIENYEEWEFRPAGRPKDLIKSAVGIPLKHGQTVIGVIALGATEPLKFTPELLQILEYFGELGSIAYTNAQLYQSAQAEISVRTQAEETLRKRTQAVERLHEFSIQMTNILASDEDFSWVADIAKQVFPQSRNVTLQLYDSQSESWQTRYSAINPNEPDYTPRQFKSRIGIAGYAVAERRIINVSNVFEDERYLVTKLPTPYYSLLVAPIIINDRILGTLSISADAIGAFDQNDERLADLLARQMAVILENRHLYTQEHEQRRFAETLREIANHLTNTAHLHTTLNEVLEMIRSVIPFKLANIVLIEAENYSLVISTPHESGSAIEDLHLDLKKLYGFGRMLETKSALLIDDTRETAGWVFHPERRWVRSYLGAPIIHQDNITGFINLDQDTPYAFAESHKQKLQAFANQIGLALEQYRLYNAEKDQRLLAEGLREASATLISSLTFDDLLQQILKVINQVIPNDAISVMLVEKGYVRFATAGGQLPDVYNDLFKTPPFRIESLSTIAEMSRTNSPLLINDTENSPLWMSVFGNVWVKSYLGAPIQISNQIVGFLNLDSQQKKFFTQRHLEAITSFANQVGIAFQKIWLLEAEREQRQIAEGLSQATVALIDATSFDDLLKHIVEVIEKVIPNDAVSIILIDENARISLAKTSGRIIEEYPEIERRVPLFLAQFKTLEYMHQNSKPLIIADTQNSSLWQEIYPTPWIRSYLGVPIRLDYQVLGFINLDSSQVNFFDERDAQILSIFADQVGIALQKIQLLESEREQRRLAEGLSKATFALTRATTVEALLQDIVGVIGRVIPSDGSSIMLIDNRQQVKIVRASGRVLTADPHIQDLPAQPLSSFKTLKRIYETGEPLLLMDTQYPEAWLDNFNSSWIHSYLGAPIKTDGKIIGFINLDSQQYAFFAEHDANTLTIFADQVGIALTKLQLLESEREQRQIAEGLRDATTALIDSASLSELFERILDVISNVIPFDGFSIMLITADNKIEIVSANKPYKHLEHAVLKPLSDFYNLLEIMRTGVPLLIPDVTKDELWKNVYDPASPLRTYVGAPIRVGTTIIGFINLDSHTTGAFEESHAQNLNVFANQVGLAVQRVRLLEAERHQRSIAEGLRDAISSLAGSLDFNALLAQIIDRIGHIVPNDAITIMLIEKGDQVRFMGGAGGIYNIEMELQPFPMSNFKTLSTMLASGEPLLIADIQDSELWSTAFGNHWASSYLGVPIKIEDKVIGFLNLDSRTSNFFNQEHSDIIRSFASQVGLAIQKIRLLEAERKQRQIAETLREIGLLLSSTLKRDDLFFQIIEQAVRVLDYTTASIWLRDANDNYTYAVGVGYEKVDITQERLRGMLLNAENSTAVQVMHEYREPVVISHFKSEYAGYEWRKSWAGAPIMLEGNLIGYLAVNHEQDGFYTDEVKPILQVLASQISVAIKNAQLFEAEQEQRQIAETMREIGLVLSSTLDTNEILAKVLEQAGRVLDYTAIAIWLRRGDIYEYVIGLGYDKLGMLEAVQALQLSDASAVAVQMIHQDRRPVIVPYFVSEFPGFEWLKSWAGAPIIVEDELVGFLAVDHAQAGFYGDQHKPLLSSFAAEISVAIKNARLYNAEKHQREIAETLREIGLVLSSTLDATQILPKILEQAARVMEYVCASIWLKDDADNFRLTVGVGYERIGGVEKVRQMRLNAENSQTVRAIYQSLAPVVISDFQAQIENFDWLHSWAGAPIFLEDDLIGYLSVNHTEHGFYTALHKPILESLATQISVAIKNAQLFEAEQQQRQIAETLREIGVALTSTLNRDEIFTKILGQVGRVIGYDAASIWLEHEDSKWRMATGVGYERFGYQDIAKTIELVPESLPSLKMVLETKAPTVVPDYHEIHPDVEGYEWLQSIAVAPIVIRDKVIGTLALDSTLLGFYNDLHKPLLSVLASQISVAVENANLFARTEAYAETLEEKVRERTAELDRERTQLRTILEGMSEGVVFIEYEGENFAGRIRYVNHMLAKMLGVEQQDLEGYQIFELSERYMEPPAYQHFLRNFETQRKIFLEKGNEHVWSFEATLRSAKQTLMDALVTMSFIHLADEDISVGIALVRDISEQKKLQRQRERFLANASHELRTPLTNLGTRIYLLQMQPEKAETHIRIIERTAQRMTQLVNDLLNFLRIEQGVIPGEVKAVNLNQIIQDIIETQQAEAEVKELSLETHFPDPPTIIENNMRHLNHLFTNLIVNAINYTPALGIVRVEIAPDTEWVLIKVTDTGRGIRPEYQETIFEPFFRGDAAESEVIGTGLGLAISKEIVDLYHGQIWVESQVGKGTTFFVRLPNHYQAAPQEGLNLFIP